MELTYSSGSRSCLQDTLGSLFQVSARRERVVSSLDVGMQEKVAFLFPGQASQFVGMGRDWWEAFQTIREVYQQANEILEFDLKRLSFEGPADLLNQTRYTQPAVFVHSISIFLILRELGWEPSVVAGHSLGEYSALVSSGALSFRDGLRAVKLRGELMQKAAEEHPGAMAAIIGMNDEEVMAACKEASGLGIVQAANLNAPGQIVISGTQAGVQQAVKLCREAGARKAVMLAVSGGFHSPLMASAQQEFASMFAEVVIKPAQLPVIDNVTADVITRPDAIRELLIQQITKPVQWVASMHRMMAMGVTRALEVGPGQVLKGLMKRIDSSLDFVSVGTVDALRELVP